MKKIIAFISRDVVVLGYAVLLIAALSCNKLIQVPDNVGGQIVTSQVFTDSANATAGVLGLYTSPYFTMQAPEQYSGCSGDELLYNSIAPTLVECYKDSMLAGGSTVAGTGSELWLYYSTDCIYQANAAIEALSTDSLISTTARNQLIGECEVMRALYHFLLVNFFGPVPIVTSTNYSVTESYGRASVDSVYGQIEKDLLDAQAKMTAAYPSTGRQRPNRYTATALLARTYLYQKQWGQAEAMADTIISSGLYSLTPSLNSVFLDRSTEAIWQVGANNPSTPNAAPGGSPFLPYFSFLEPTFALTTTQLAAFEPGDLRKSDWVNVSNAFGGPYYYPYKYKNLGVTINPYGTTEDLMIVRLAEIYLIRAEAEAYLGDLAGAASDVNTIRTRAGLGNTTFNTLGDAITGILHERQTELFCEWGNRWFDLKRNDSLDAVLTREKPQYWPADGHTALFPIPINEIIANPNLTQNPGY